jgi:hypothetical protein
MHLREQEIPSRRRGSAVASPGVRRLAFLTAAALVVLAAAAALAWSFTPQVNTYRGPASSGGVVQFRIDTHTAHSFAFESRTLFSNAPLEHHIAADGTGVWRFHTHNEHWRVHGHWVGHTTVHGSICNLTASPTGCPEGAHLQTYVAEAKDYK